MKKRFGPARNDRLLRRRRRGYFLQNIIDCREVAGNSEAAVHFDLSGVVVRFFQSFSLDNAGRAILAAETFLLKHGTAT